MYILHELKDNKEINYKINVQNIWKIDYIDDSYLILKKLRKLHRNYKVFLKIYKKTIEGIETWQV